MARRYWIAFAVLAAGLVLLVLNDSAGEIFGLQNDMFARTLYLGVLAAVLAAGYLASSRGLGSVLRNLVLWLLVLLALVAGYQYRYELQDVASRITAGFIPGSPISLRMDDGTQTVVLEKASSGHFEARAEVDGATVNFVVDTGATATVLSAADAAAVGIDPASLSYSIPVQTANGLARAARATVGEIRIGSIFRNRVTVLVAAPGQLGQSLLGMNFIGTLSGFDVRGDRLILRD